MSFVLVLLKRLTMMFQLAAIGAEQVANQKLQPLAIIGAPFPADPHYDAKAWELCVAMRGPGRVLFWNVAPLPRP
jgi:hypothetical protein